MGNARPEKQKIETDEKSLAPISLCLISQGATNGAGARHKSERARSAADHGDSLGAAEGGGKEANSQAISRGSIGWDRDGGILEQR